MNSTAHVVIHSEGWRDLRAETHTETVSALASRLGYGAGTTAKVMAGTVEPSPTFIALAMYAFNGIATFRELFTVQ